MSEPFIGEIKLWPGTFAPRGWAFCDGRLISIMDNQPLFAILNCNYGGDGRINFALPDLRGRVPMGAGRGPGLTNRILGARQGLEAVELTIAAMPEHKHNISTATQVDSLNVTIKGYDGRPDTTSLAGNVLAQPASGTGARDNIYPAYSTQNPNQNMSSAMTEVSGDITVTANIENNGGSSPHENIQPSLVLNYIIALNGIFPSRS